MIYGVGNEAIICQRSLRNMSDVKPFSEDVKPKVSEVIAIRVVDQEEQEVLFKIKRSTTLKKMIDAYCERKGLTNRSEIRFSFRGERIRDTNTPLELEMEDGDTIDVLLQQVGGQ